MSTAFPIAPRTALFLPASNARAIEKARGLPADMIILDLEDAVKDADKDSARAAAQAAAGSFGDRPVAIRVNVRGSDHWKDDLKAVKRSAATHVVIPKVEEPTELTEAAWYARRPILAMIETPAGVMNVAQIASASSSTTGWGVKMAGLIAGTNDLAAGLRLPPGAGRGSMTAALQLVVLAARARQIWAIDGVCNALDDPTRLEAECAEGRMLGFDGKSLIHPGQIDIATRAFSPNTREIADAEALLAAFGGGAERHRGEMIEGMHVDAARALLARAGKTVDSPADIA